MISKTVQGVVGLVAFGVVMTFAYQNCNSGLTKMRSTLGSDQPVTPLDTGDGKCTATVKSWQNGNVACSASTPNMTNGMEQLLIDNAKPSVGSATVRCVNGVINVATEFSQTCQIQSVNPTNGACGTLHNTSVASMPQQPSVQQLCQAGTAGVIIGTSGPWTWSCAGIGSGSTTVNCLALLQGTPPSNGSCGSSNNQTLTSIPTTGLCAVGTATTVIGTGPWVWSCPGTGGGSTATCMAQMQSVQPTNGACGSSNNQTLTARPTTGLCTAGTATTVNGSGPWTWSCSGANGGSTATCTAQLQGSQSTNGSCGSSNNQTLTARPTTGLCTAGTATNVNGSGPWTWSCTGANGGTTANCTAQLQGAPPTNGACGSSNNQTLTSLPTTGLCAAGTATTVTGSGPWNWSCTGTNGGSTASCTAQEQTNEQAPQCGAASVGSRGYTSLSEFDANDYCFTSGSTPVNLAGGSTGPWSWNCRNSSGATSGLCKASKATTEACNGGGTGVKTGSQSCTQQFGETTKTCSACRPTVCDTGYQITGSPPTCEPLNTGSCAVPAGIMRIKAPSTLSYLSCEKTMTAQTLNPGSQVTVSCSNNGFNATTILRCSQRSDVRPTDNGGASFNFKFMEYRHGRINNSDADSANWAYAILGLQSGGYIFDEHIQREITYNFACSSSVDYSISSWNSAGGPAFRIMGTGLSPRTSGSRQMKCVQTDDENPTMYLVSIRCDGVPTNGPEGFWQITNAEISTPVAGQQKCTAGGKTANLGSWTAF